MTKPVAIIAGEPNSISSEIIFKSWKLRKRYNHKPLIIIGNIQLLNLQKKKLKYHIRIKEINSNFNMKDLSRDALPVLDVEYKQKKSFQRISSKSNKYIFKCFDVATNLFRDKKILGFINCPISKEFLFKNKYQGITEFLSKKAGEEGNEVMLIYNKKLSVCPLTTHIPLRQVSSKIIKSKIIKKTKTINNFYKKILNKKPCFAILGLNPHSFSATKKFEEKEIILPAIRTIFDVILGMYHDQVLTPFKALFEYEAINITLGLPYIRISPDHGVAENIIGKNIANPKSLIASIKFFNKVK